MLDASGQGGDSIVMKLEDLGWSESLSFVEMQEGHVAARVVAAQRERYRLLTPDGAFDAMLSGSCGMKRSTVRCRSSATGSRPHCSKTARQSMPACRASRR